VRVRRCLDLRARTVGFGRRALVVLAQRGNIFGLQIVNDFLGSRIGARQRLIIVLPRLLGVLLRKRGVLARADLLRGSLRDDRLTALVAETTVVHGRLLVEDVRLLLLLLRNLLLLLVLFLII
jgi:hypothetical protein